MILFWDLCKKVLFYHNCTVVDIISEQSDNATTSQRRDIEQKSGKNLTLGQTTFCRPGGEQIKIVHFAMFLHFYVYIYIYEYFFDFCGFFFAESFQNPATVSELPKWSVSKA